MLEELLSFLKDCGGKLYYQGLTDSLCWDSQNDSIHFRVSLRKLQLTDLKQAIDDARRLHGDVLRHRNVRPVWPDSPDTIREGS